MDTRVRDLERLWAVTGDSEAGRRYLQQRRRTGETEFQIRVLLSGLFSSLGRNEFGLEDYLHTDSGIVMVAIPAGEFLMGAPDGQGHEEERPQHRVVFHRPFLIAKYAVTQGEWKKVMGLDNNPSHFQGEEDRWGHPYDRHPVEQISWDDAQEFCRRTMLRLPTEAMWEYACRAGTTTRYHSGDDERDLERVAWFGRDFNEGHRAVGLKEHNQFGLGDMHGNTFEWCQDPWNRNYEGAPENGFIAWGDDTGYNHALWVQGELEELTLQAVGARPPAEVVEEHPEEEQAKRRSVYGLSLKLAPDPTRPPGGRSTAPGHGAASGYGAASGSEVVSPSPDGTGATPTSESPSSGSDQAGSPDPTAPAPQAGTSQSAGTTAPLDILAPSSGSTKASVSPGSSDPTRSSSAPQLGPGSLPTTTSPVDVAGLTPMGTVANPNSDSESLGSSDPTSPAPRAGAIQSAGTTAPLDTLAICSGSTPAFAPPGSSDPTQASEPLALQDGQSWPTTTTARPGSSAPSSGRSTLTESNEPGAPDTPSRRTVTSASDPSGRSSFPVQQMHVGEAAGQDTREVQTDPDPMLGDGPRASDASSPGTLLPHHPLTSRRPSSGSRPSVRSESTRTSIRLSSASTTAENDPSDSGDDDSTETLAAAVEQDSSASESRGVDAELLDDPTDDVDLSIPYVSIAALDREDEPDPTESLGLSSGSDEGLVAGHQSKDPSSSTDPSDPATTGGHRLETAASGSAGDERCSDPPRTSESSEDRTGSNGSEMIPQAISAAGCREPIRSQLGLPISPLASAPSGDEERSPDPTGWGVSSESTLPMPLSTCSQASTTAPSSSGSSTLHALGESLEDGPSMTTARRSPRTSTESVSTKTQEATIPGSDPSGAEERSSDPTHGRKASSATTRSRMASSTPLSTPTKESYAASPTRARAAARGAASRSRGRSVSRVGSETTFQALTQTLNSMMQSTGVHFPPFGRSGHDRVNDLERLKQSIQDILLQPPVLEPFGILDKAFRPRSLRGAQRSSQRGFRARTPLQAITWSVTSTVRDMGFRVCWA